MNLFRSEEHVRRWAGFDPASAAGILPAAELHAKLFARFGRYRERLAPDYLDRVGFPYDVYSPRAAGIDFYGDNLFTTEKEIALHPARVKAFRAASMRGWVYAMSHQEEISASTDELTNAVQSVVETFQPYRADHRPDCTDLERWLIWNDQTCERLGIVALDGPHEHAFRRGREHPVVHP